MVLKSYIFILLIIVYNATLQSMEDAMQPIDLSDSLLQEWLNVIDRSELPLLKAMPASQGCESQCDQVTLKEFHEIKKCIETTSLEVKALKKRLIFLEKKMEKSTKKRKVLEQKPKDDSSASQKLAKLMKAIFKEEYSEVEKQLLVDAPINEKSEQTLKGLTREAGQNGHYKKRMLTPLHLAVYLNNTPITKLLLAHKADPDIASDEGITPLMTAVALENTKNINALLKAQVKIETKDQYGRSAFTIGEKKKGLEITSLLQNNATV